jgi:hypothetical protein
MIKVEAPQIEGLGGRCAGEARDVHQHKYQCPHATHGRPSVLIGRQTDHTLTQTTGTGWIAVETSASVAPAICSLARSSITTAAGKRAATVERSALVWAFGVRATEANTRDIAEIGRAVADFAREPKGGVGVLPGQFRGAGPAVKKAAPPREPEQPARKRAHRWT